MALIKCPECGKEISDKSSTCIHCGYPIGSEKVKSQRKSTSIRITPPKGKLVLIIVVILALISGLIFGGKRIAEIREEKAYQAQLEAERQAYQTMLEESRKNIAPYLEVIPCRPDEETGKILLPSELYENIDNIEFLGLKGSIAFQKDEYGVIDTVYWRSHDFFTFDEHQEFVPLLNDFFGTEAVMGHYLIGQWTQKHYYWEDDSIPTVVVFYTSVRANHEQETDRIEIYWDMDAEMPD